MLLFTKPFLNNQIVILPDQGDQLLVIVYLHKNYLMKTESHSRRVCDYILNSNIFCLSLLNSSCMIIDYLLIYHYCIIIVLIYPYCMLSC